MKIVFLTQYYPPETGAPQNRLSELAIRFVAAGDEVQVLTAMPNYPFMTVFPGYKGKWYVREEENGVIIHRAAIYTKKSKSLFIRLLNYFSFVFTAWWIGTTRLPRVDLIICESPPLFLGITAWLLKRNKKAALLFNVSDLWPESAEKLGLVTNRTFLKMARKLEEFIYRKSDMISGQTQGIVKDISHRFPDKPIFWLKNGVDLAFYDPAQATRKWREEQGFSPDDFVLFYGGILGYAQGLEVILQAADLLRDHENILFVIAGDGPLSEELQATASRMSLSRVHFLPAYPKTKMPEVIAGIDASIVPLRDLPLFRGAIPSKIFESLAMKKPVLLGVLGEAHELFVERGGCALPFTPEDPRSLADAILRLQGDPETHQTLSENAYLYVSEAFDREKIFADFQNFISNQLSKPKQ